MKSLLILIVPDFLKAEAQFLNPKIAGDFKINNNNHPSTFIRYNPGLLKLKKEFKRYKKPWFNLYVGELFSYSYVVLYY